MEPKPVIELYDFLVESELQHYYNAIKNELKITLVPHLKYASDEDLKQVGLSKPEIRRLRKFYEKYYPHGYLSKIKRLLQNPAGKREEVGTLNNASSTETLKTISSPSKLPSNKHIIPADSICVNKQLGVGEFGIVQQGVWTNGNERIQVAIKCLCRERMLSNPMEFLKEAAIMHSIEHENIVRLYGVVLDTDSLMLVTELAHLRSLLECLKDSGLRVSFLTVPTLCEFAQQICSGMMYLENKRLIHRDLAARNILVFSKSKVKISDFGLSRALGVGKDYYQTNFNVNLKLPIAWCAPECINFLRFTNASDVWAFGVCLWEMFSYGFQPWAALTGHQILEAIDEPHYQRLEQPECCPKEYYTLMLKCWQHDPSKRPKFCEIHSLLPDMKPEQLKTISAYSEAKKDRLMYRQNDIITVLDKPNSSAYWKGVLNSGKTGMFNPSNTVAYLGNSLPSSVNRDSFVRGSERTSSRRKLCPEMISGPQNDLKHTGHVGLDGAYFGDVAFLSSSSNSQSYNHVPRQIVTPYKPSEDIEQTPLLPSTPTSPDSLQTASGYFAENNHTFLNAHSAQTNDGFNSSFDFPNQNSSTPVTSAAASNAGFTSSNPFVNLDNSTHNKILSEGGGFTNILEEENFSKEHNRKNSMKWVGDTATAAAADSTHEYHEISDDEMPGEKFDLGPSLLDEMDFMFRSMSANSEHGELKSPDFENNNKKNEIAELAAKFQRKNSGGLLPGSIASLKSKKKLGNSASGAGNVKPISTKDEKILNQAIDFANEISARSMTDLVNDSANTQSPKRKFSFRFPHLAHHSNSGDKDSSMASPNSQHHKGSHGFKTRNFSEEAKNVPDLQDFITEECREAYNSLVEKPASTLHRFNYEIANLKNSLQLSSSMSALQMPTGKSTAIDGRDRSSPIVPDNSLASAQPSITQNCTSEMKMPTKPAPRPTTLPNRSSTPSKLTQSQADSDTNPLHILRDKNYRIIRPRMKVNSIDATTIIDGSASIDANGNQDDACESPSYLLTNTQYTFSERDVNIHHNDTQKFIGNKEIENLNPIPLPPRDRNKVLLTNVKRHVRKHPLIIPATGLQRTLSKVSSPMEEKNPLSAFSAAINHDEIDGGAKSLSNSNKINYNMPRTSTKPAEVMKLKQYTSSWKKFIENNFAEDECRTYENLDALRMHMDNTDSASLHFESILEGDINKVGDMSSNSTAHSFLFESENYDIPRANAPMIQQPNCGSEVASYENTNVNNDIERKRREFSHKYPNYAQPKNELTDNALFNKFRESADECASTSSGGNKITHRSNTDEDISGDESIDELSEGKLKDSNSVSCEDLLEFANKKPKGKERGIESDEVRIMSKVLGTNTTPEQCIIALDFIEWNVHRAIKIISLQNALKSKRSISFEECVEALQKNDWDLHATSIKLNT
ncbi:activated Cdc42 kinase-like isoform X4 [Sitodiplosis mosellana]|uniref:activated Cdc42 kinase-like isoform X4 n=1 Tax=Sitodiplosis mosellana TaxID=263140 RepID=UPI00244433E2|nr:activated Cdc42 kinase-like isoform X4 [Sitodiplosis mosellana]